MSAKKTRFTNIFRTSEWWGRYILSSPSALPPRTVHKRRPSVRPPHHAHWHGSDRAGVRMGTTKLSYDGEDLNRQITLNQMLFKCWKKKFFLCGSVMMFDGGDQYVFSFFIRYRYFRKENFDLLFKSWSINQSFFSVFVLQYLVSLFQGPCHYNPSSNVIKSFSSMMLLSLPQAKP